MVAIVIAALVAMALIAPLYGLERLIERVLWSGLGEQSQ